MAEVVVTGSHIPRRDLAGVSPVTTIGAADIRAAGFTRVDDAINRLPLATPDQSATVSNGATGAATVNLRSLGPERTLVLIDGKRLLPGDTTSGEIAPDLNFIPDALVDRIEIVTGGASAVYGSDAIAGVVNFIMKKDFIGLKVDAQSGFYNHVNGERAIQALLIDQGDPVPPGIVNDGLTTEVTLVAGANSPNAKGNVTAYGGYRRTDAIAESARDFSACPLQPTHAGPVCSGSTISPALGRFVVFDQATGKVVGDLSLDPAGPAGSLRPFHFGDAFNFAPYNYFQRSDDRYVAGVFAHYEIAPDIDLYAQGMFMDDRTVAQIAPSGLFLAQVSISCASPLLSAAEVTRFCADSGVPAGGDALLFLGRRDVEGGGRQALLSHRDYRLLAGAEGEAGPWRYDASVQYSAVNLSKTDLNDISLSRAADALDVVRGPSGDLICASGNPGCVPYDVFKIGGVTPAAIAYLSEPGVATGSTSEIVASATLSGELGGYGVESPWSRDGFGLALGAEYRRESLSYAPDAEIASGDLAGDPFPSPAVSGAFHVQELYAEVRAPLVRDGGPLLRDLGLEGGYRLSWYSDAGRANTYKAGAEWEPVSGVRLRASFNHAVRAPNVVELFTPQTLAMTGLSADPCAGPDPAAADPLATPANCAHTGVAPGQYGAIVANPVGYNSIEGGNPKLRPENADTRTLGVVFTPAALGDFRLAIDYFEIDVSGAIGAPGADLTVQVCLQTGDPTSCQLIHRAPGTGSLWLGPQGYVVDIGQNTSSLRTRGVDVEAFWRLPLPAWRGARLGHVSVALDGGYVASFTAQSVPGALPYDCAGFHGFICGGPLPKWRHVLRTTWNAPRRFDLSLAWRYIAPVRLDATSSNPFLAGPFSPGDAGLAARSYFDLSVNWRLNRRLELRAGVNNLFDIDPPVVGIDVVGPFPVTNGNTYPGLYDSLGRFAFLGLTATL
ncbi:MAG: TonB-dependent receptor domain-containing protein [Caulobacteraceae bacterium]